jgi:hypothetical protein
MAVKMTNMCEPLTFSWGKFKRFWCYLVSKYHDVSVVQVLSNVLCICIVTEDNFCPFFAMAQASFHEHSHSLPLSHHAIFIRQILVCNDNHYMTIVTSNEGIFPYKFIIFLRIFQHSVSCLMSCASVVSILTSSNCPSTFPTLLVFLQL